MLDSIPQVITTALPLLMPHAVLEKEKNYQDVDCRKEVSRHEQPLDRNIMCEIREIPWDNIPERRQAHDILGPPECLQRYLLPLDR